MCQMVQSVLISIYLKWDNSSEISLTTNFILQVWNVRFKTLTHFPKMANSRDVWCHNICFLSLSQSSFIQKDGQCIQNLFISIHLVFSLFTVHCSFIVSFILPYVFSPTHLIKSFLFLEFSLLKMKLHFPLGTIQEIQ